MRAGRFLVGAMVICVLSRAGADEPVVAGIDHVIVAVEDLEAATATFEALGFALKPGRPHDNGIANRHIKFADGAEIELLTVADARDELTSIYRRHLDSQGDGPAFAGLFAPDRPALLQRLSAADLKPVDAGLVTLADEPMLEFLFFGRRNQSPSDRPEHFAHPNGAAGLIGVWLAPEDPRGFVRLLQSLGAELSRVPADVLEPGLEVPVLAMADGFVAVLDRRFRQFPGRPVIGVTVLIDADHSVIISPAQAHGLWIELRGLDAKW